MRNNIFIPQKISVGFCNRDDTYTKKLAYVIYYDQNGTLRKEASWNNWRDKNIEPKEFNNTPISGFVLNKKAGGYSTGWNHRQTYVRVYDPRDFEFEISVANLLYILENTSSIKGKGLEGEFVYGWDGSDIVLIPTSSPDFIELEDFNATLFAKDYVKAKDLIIGATYQTNKNNELIYLGKYECFCEWHGTSEGKQFFFAGYNNCSTLYFETMKSINKRIVAVKNNSCVSNYADIMDSLGKRRMFSPIDESRNIIIPYQLNEFKEEIDNNQNYWGNSFYDKTGKKYTIRKNKESGKYEREVPSQSWSWGTDYQTYKSIEELYDLIQPVHIEQYLTNGNYYGRKY